MRRLIFLIVTLLWINHSSAFSQTIQPSDQQLNQQSTKSVSTVVSTNPEIKVTDETSDSTRTSDALKKNIKNMQAALQFEASAKVSNHTNVSPLGKPLIAFENKETELKRTTKLSKGKNQQSNSEDFWKFEFFGGYQYSRSGKGITGDDIEDAFDINNLYDNEDNNSYNDFTPTRGLNLQATYNFTRFLGAKFDFSATGTNSYAFVTRTVGNSISGEVIRNDFKIYNFLGGIQFKDNRKDGSRFKPFGHLLAGVARSSNKFDGDDLSRVFGPGIGSFDAKIYDTSFAAALGGGLDIAVNRRFDIRVFQLDFNPVFLNDKSLVRRTPFSQANFFSNEQVTIDRGIQHNYRFSFGIVIH